MTKTPWIIEFYSDKAPHKHAACFGKEEDARAILHTLHEHQAMRCVVADDRGFEIRLFPDRYTIVLIPPATSAALEKEAQQGAAQTVIAAGSDSTQ